MQLLTEESRALVSTLFTGIVAAATTGALVSRVTPVFKAILTHCVLLCLQNQSSPSQVA